MARAWLARCGFALNPYREGRPRWVRWGGHLLVLVAAVVTGFAFLVAIFAAGSANPGGLGESSC